MLFEYGLREKIYLAVMFKKKIKLEMKSKSDKIKNFELNLLSLVDNLTEDSKIEINELGNIVIINPGYLKNGSYSHICNQEKSISYYLEFMLYILPLFDSHVEINFIGNLNSSTDLSIEIIRYIMIPLLRKFFSDEIRLKLLNKKNSHSKLLLIFKNHNKNINFNYHDMSDVKSIRCILSYSSSNRFDFNRNIYNSILKIFGKVHNYKVFENHFPTSKVFFYSFNLIGLRKNGGNVYDSLVTNKKLDLDLLEKSIHLYCNGFKKKYLKDNKIDDKHQIFLLICLINSKNCEKKKILINSFTRRTITFIRIMSSVMNLNFQIKFISTKNKIMIIYN